jgi:hypothetical protein
MILPNPAHATVTWHTTDPITDQVFIEQQTFFMAFPKIVGETELMWEIGDYQLVSRTMTGPMQNDGLGVVGTTTNGATYRLRPVDPYDALQLSDAGVPQPVEAIRAAFQGGSLATELDAVVAPDNTVATLMLDTSVGVYLRFGHSWQLLGPDSTALEDMSLVPVAAGALEVWDAGEASNSRVMVSDFPVKVGDGGVSDIHEPSAPDPKMPGADGSVVASGTAIPEVMDMEDLAVAVQFGELNPDARWFIEKRAKALGARKPVWGKAS